jgi:hypothetical protein
LLPGKFLGEMKLSDKLFNGRFYRASVAGFIVGGLVLLSSPAAAGAVAVGVGSGGAYASGGMVNQPTVKQAASAALKGCKGSPGANSEAKGKCKVVATFTDQCEATAIDPADGTPGNGWGVGATSTDATDQAMQKCRATAGAGRESFCRVIEKEVRCDGTAK